MTFVTIKNNATAMAKVVIIFITNRVANDDKMKVIICCGIINLPLWLLLQLQYIYYYKYVNSFISVVRVHNIWRKKIFFFKV
jgi:hypothetical protein